MQSGRSKPGLDSAVDVSAYLNVLAFAALARDAQCPVTQVLREVGDLEEGGFS